MVGKAFSSLGLIAAAAFLLIVGYLLTLNVYQDEGAYTIFYSGRYYGGIVCMIVGGLLFLSGLALPFIWPTPKKGGKLSPLGYSQSSEQLSSGNQIVAQDVDVTHSQRLTNSSSIESEITALSMQSTLGAESIKILKMLLQRPGSTGCSSRCSLSLIAQKISTGESKTKKALNLLLNLGLIEKHFGNEETYSIPSSLEKRISHAIDSVA